MSTRRSPQGERGLKLRKERIMEKLLLSLSARRAWIEIPSGKASRKRTLSRSPQGERGLKYLRTSHRQDSTRVALRKESVD